ncbi:MAG: hypothetical protein IKQ39_06490 [Oscillospiraceae bacterium]|nr:hypothetical protein [Oscillospiraceae bacterium]
MNATAFGCLFAGLFLLIPSWRDWDWFFLGWRMRFMTELFGREKTRLFYMVLGGLLTGAGLLLLLDL